MVFTINGKKLTAQKTINKNTLIKSSPHDYNLVWDNSKSVCKYINDVLSENTNNLLLIDKNVYSLYGQQIIHSKKKIFKISPNEHVKSLQGFIKVFDFLCKNNFTKHEKLIVVGGGITQDLGAFVGASFKRGINWVYFPTTLLSMCDSCIGGKSGLNYNDLKNQLALFSAPHKIIINTNFLKSLSIPHIKSGLGEILKLLITGRPDLLPLYADYIKKNFKYNGSSLKKLIVGALSVKKPIIEADEFEKNIRKSLNYGHTIGHAIESLSNFKIPHGVAVTIGIIIANEISFNLGILNEKSKNILHKYAKHLIDKKTIRLLQTLDYKNILKMIKQDKKTTGNHINFILLKEPTRTVFKRLKISKSLLTEVKHAVKKIAS